MKFNKLLLPLVSLVLASCGSSTSGEIIEPTDIGKEVDSIRVAFEGTIVNFKKGMTNEELWAAVHYFKDPGLSLLYKSNANFEFAITAPNDIAFSAKGQLRYYFDLDSTTYITNNTSSGGIEHHYAQKFNADAGIAEIFNYSTRDSKLIYINGIDAKEKCNYVNDNVDNEKAKEDKNYIHASTCIAHYNNFFYDSYENITFDFEDEQLIFETDISYKITEKYLIVETNRPHGVYAQIDGTAAQRYALYLSALNRDDLFYKQIRYYNFDTKLLEYQGLSLKTMTSNLKPGMDISFEGKISFLNAMDEAVNNYREITKYVKDNTTKKEDF